MSATERTEYLGERPIVTKLHVVFEVSTDDLLKWNDRRIWIALPIDDAETLAEMLLEAIRQKREELKTGA